MGSLNKMLSYPDFSITQFAAPDPAKPAVTLGQAHKQLEIDDSIRDDDDYINLLISTATSTAQNFTGRRLITQTVDLTIDQFPCGSVWNLPVGPLQSITSITYLDTNGASQTLATTIYGYETKSFVPRIWIKSGQSIPQVQVDTLNTVTIRALVGYGADYSYVPSEITHAIKMTVHELYEERKNTSEIDLKKVQMTVESLLTDYKAIWF